MAKMLCLVSAVTLVVVLCADVSGQASWDDPCTVNPAGASLTDEGGEVTVPTQCEAGDIWWNYPRGTLQVIFGPSRGGRTFTVCLTPALGPLLGSISQLVNGHLLTVPSPNAEGETACLPKAGTTVTAMLEQPSFLTYMTLYNYSLHFQH